GAAARAGGGSVPAPGPADGTAAPRVDANQPFRAPKSSCISIDTAAFAAPVGDEARSALAPRIAAKARKHFSETRSAFGRAGDRPMREPPGPRGDRQLTNPASGTPGRIHEGRRRWRIRTGKMR